MAKTVPLSRPLKTHDGEITQLQLRDLTARDIVQMKEAPFRVLRRGDAETVELEIRYDVSMKYLSALSGIDDLILGGLSSSDFQQACTAVGNIWNDLGE